ncbi:hypothetical protein ACFVT9_38610 [Kitasatospora cineracea]|uniref:hypothetical protein n=1 Tax=Kitasatospora cineracea TaxID=88074 RepID=UPI0036DD6D15
MDTVLDKPLEVKHPCAAWGTNTVGLKKVTQGLLPGRSVSGVPQAWAHKTLSVHV